MNKKDGLKNSNNNNYNSYLEININNKLIIFLLIIYNNLSYKKKIKEFQIIMLITLLDLIITENTHLYVFFI